MVGVKQYTCTLVRHLPVEVDATVPGFSHQPHQLHFWILVLEDK